MPPPDESTASPDRRIRQVVLDVMTGARKRGTAILGLRHEFEPHDIVFTHTFDVFHDKDTA